MNEPLPSRDDGATIPCPVCQRAFVPSGRRRHCGDPCRKKAWALRHQAPPAPVVVPESLGPRRPVTVYLCEVCDTRALGDQRCESCGNFMRRLGYGGLCPCCQEAVAAGELIEVVEAKRGRR